MIGVKVLFSEYHQNILPLADVVAPLCGYNASKSRGLKRLTGHQTVVRVSYLYYNLCAKMLRYTSTIILSFGSA